MKKLLALLLFISGSSVSAQTAPEIEAYKIPDDAEKSSPARSFIVGYSSRMGSSINYFVKNREGKRDLNPVGTETYLGAVLIKRTLMRNGRLHGISREWFEDGTPKSESPYRDGVMDGLFRQWDKKGQLISQYQMDKGTGIMRAYGSNGVLLQQKSFIEKREKGLSYTQGEEGFTLAFFEKDVPLKEFSFYNDGSVRRISLVNPKNNYNALRIVYGPKGEQWGAAYILNTKVLKPEEYEKAFAQDANLLPYYADQDQYKEFITPEIQALADKYRTMPHVKIPLEFDAQGNPVLAPVEVAPATQPAER